MSKFNLPSGPLGLRLLGVGLLVTGLLILAPGPHFAGASMLLAILALVAGILILLGRSFEGFHHAGSVSSV
jgi:hypothetical protein